MASIFENPNYRPFEKVAGKISINVRGNSISFSKQLLSKLDYPHFIQVFINPTDRKLGIRVCSQEDVNSLRFVPEGKGKIDSLRWSNPQFTREIRAMVDGQLSSQDFTCSGEFIPDENAVLIDMMTASQLVSKA